MYYFIIYEYEGKAYEKDVRPNEDVLEAIQSILDSGGVITGLKKQAHKPTSWLY